MTNLNIGNHPTKRQSGYALTELLFTMGIIALVLGTIASIAVNQSASATAKNQARTIEQAIQDLRLIFLRQNSFAGLDMDTSIDLDIWPEEKIVNGGAGRDVLNEWGSPLDLTIAAGIDPGQTVLRVNVDNVPQNACAELAAYNFSNSRMTVDGDVVYNITGVGAAVDPFDAATAADKCSDASNDISIWFSKDS